MFELSMTGRTVLWAATLVAFLIAEASTFQLVSIWFALGALGALIANVCGLGFAAQVGIFIVVSAVSLIATRPLVKKFTKAKIQSTNVDRCINTDAVVIEEIDNLNSKGQVKSDGKIWTARSADNSIIPENSVVTVKKIEGVKLIVEIKKQ